MCVVSFPDCFHTREGGVWEQVYASGIIHGSLQSLDWTGGLTGGLETPPPPPPPPPGENL